MKLYNNNNSGSRGIGFLGALLLLLIGLKLCGVIDWAWLWVLSPIWIYAIWIALVFVIALIYYLIRK